MGSADPWAPVAPNPAAAPSPTPSAPPAPSSPPSAIAIPRSRLLVIAVALIVAAVIILSAFWVAGAGPFGRSPGPLPDNATFGQARAAADSATNSYHGGGWYLLGAGGLSSEYGAPIPFTSRNLTANCSVVPVSGASETITLPSATPGAGSGTAPLWIFLYRNVTGGILIVSVEGGHATLTATLSGGTGCSTYVALSAFVTALPTSVVDSSAAVSAANGAGGSTFLTAYPNATTVLTLRGAITLGATQLSPATWSVTYTLCAPTARSTTIEPSFNATVSASDGSLLAEHTGNVTCTLNSSIPGLPSSPTGPSGSLALGAPLEAGDVYSIPVQETSGSLVLGDTTIEVRSPSGTLVAGSSGPLNVTDVAIDGCDRGLYNFSTGGWSSPTLDACSGSTGELAPIVVGDVFRMVAGGSLSGDIFEVVGQGSFAGVVSVDLP